MIQTGYQYDGYMRCLRPGIYGIVPHMVVGTSNIELIALLHDIHWEQLLFTNNCTLLLAIFVHYKIASH